MSAQMSRYFYDGVESPHSPKHKNPFQMISFFLPTLNCLGYGNVGRQPTEGIVPDYTPVL